MKARADENSSDKRITKATALWVVVLWVEVTEWVEVAALQRGDGGEKLGIKISVSASA